MPLLVGSAVWTMQNTAVRGADLTSVIRDFVVIVCDENFGEPGTLVPGGRDVFSAPGTDVPGSPWRRLCRLTFMLDESSDLIAGLQTADDAAAEELYRRYGRRIVGLARQRLRRALQSKVDPEDVLQSVCRSFFRRLGLGQIYLSDEEALWSLLATITTRKCINRHTYFRAERRSVQREIQLSAIPPQDPQSPTSGDPTASAVAIMLETIEQALSGFSVREREMVRCSLEGFNVREISVRTGRAERTVRRALARARKTLSLVDV